MLNIIFFYLCGIAGPLLVVLGYCAWVGPYARWAMPPMIVFILGVGVLPLAQGLSKVEDNCRGGLPGALAAFVLSLVSVVLSIITLGPRPPELAAYAVVAGPVAAGFVAPVLAAAGVFWSRRSRAASPPLRGSPGLNKELRDAVLLALAVLACWAPMYQIHRSEDARSRAVGELHGAIRAGHSEKALSLLDQASGLIGLTDSDGRYAIDVAVGTGNEVMVRTLMDRGARLSVYQAIMLGWAQEVAKMLDEDPSLIKGSPPPRGRTTSIFDWEASRRRPGPIPWTALEFAAMYRRTEIAKLLLSRGADPNAGIVSAPLCHAMGDIELARILLGAGADANGKNIEGKTPLFDLPANRLDIARLLLDHHADPNARMGSGQTLLVFTILKSTELVELLLDAGADPNARGGDDETALYRAVAYRSEKRKRTVELLLAHGADPTIVDTGSRQSPLDLARSLGETELVEMMEKAKR